jgi:hypothetical protein
VIEVRLHRELYKASAVDEAVAVYTPYATLERFDQADHWGVKVSASGDRRERRVAGELANYALGLAAKEHAAGGTR